MGDATVKRVAGLDPPTNPYSGLYRILSGQYPEIYLHYFIEWPHMPIDLGTLAGTIYLATEAEALSADAIGDSCTASLTRSTRSFG